MTCQQIAQNDQLWANASAATRRQWSLCLKSLHGLEERLAQARMRRQKWALRLKIGGFLLTIVQNTFAGITAALPFVFGNVPGAVTKMLQVLVFIFSMAMWSRMGEKAHQYLVVAGDLSKAEKFAASVRGMLADVASDGVITAEERARIIDAMGAIGRMGESIGPLSEMTRILGESADKDTRDAIGEVNDVVKQITRDSSRFNQQYPEAMRQYAEARVRVPLHAQAPVGDGEMNPPA